MDDATGADEGSGMDRMDDEDLDWLAGLDWKTHGPARDGYVSRDIFLAEAAEMLGRRICGVWPGPAHFLRMAEIPPTASVVEAHDAFDADGRPVVEVHDREGDAMRDHADALGVTLADVEAIDRREWANVVEILGRRLDDGVGARRAAAGIARAFARLAFEEKTKVYARPMDGTGRVRLGPEFWEIDDDQAIRRLASCALALDRPYDAAAEPDHRIFVEHDGYGHALALAASRWYVPVSFTEFEGLQREDDYVAVQVSEVARFLEGLMVPANSDWNNERFKVAVQDEFGSRGLGVVFDRAKARAVAHPDRSYFGKAGRRRIPAPQD